MLIGLAVIECGASAVISQWLHALVYFLENFVLFFRPYGTSLADCIYVVILIVVTLSSSRVVLMLQSMKIEIYI